MKNIYFSLNAVNLLSSLLMNWPFLDKQDSHQTIVENQYHVTNDNLRLDDPCANFEKNICLVCKRKAGRHLYYGAKSCQSCRAFYRRSVMRIRR